MFYQRVRRAAPGRVRIVPVSFYKYITPNTTTKTSEFAHFLSIFDNFMSESDVFVSYSLSTNPRIVRKSPCVTGIYLEYFRYSDHLIEPYFFLLEVTLA